MHWNLVWSRCKFVQSSVYVPPLGLATYIGVFNASFLFQRWRWEDILKILMHEASFLIISQTVSSLLFTVLFCCIFTWTITNELYYLTILQFNQQASQPQKKCSKEFFKTASNDVARNWPLVWTWSSSFRAIVCDSDTQLKAIASPLLENNCESTSSNFLKTDFRQIMSWDWSGSDKSIHFSDHTEVNQSENVDIGYYLTV